MVAGAMITLPASTSRLWLRRAARARHSALTTAKMLTRSSSRRPSERPTSFSLSIFLRKIGLMSRTASAHGEKLIVRRLRRLFTVCGNILLPGKSALQLLVLLCIKGSSLETLLPLLPLPAAFRSGQMPTAQKLSCGNMLCVSSVWLPQPRQLQ